MTNPNNIVRLHSRNGGRGSVYEANMWAQTWSSGLFSGNGVLQNQSVDTNVLVGGTPNKPDVAIGENPSGYKIALDIVGQQALQITAPASNSRIASVVAYTDDLSLASSDDNTTGNPSSCGLIVVYGPTQSSPEPPSKSEIRSAITADGATGSQAVFCVIANVTIGNGTTAITSNLITKNKASLTSDAVEYDSIDYISLPVFPDYKERDNLPDNFTDYTAPKNGWLVARLLVDTNKFGSKASIKVNNFMVAFSQWNGQLFNYNSQNNILVPIRKGSKITCEVSSGGSVTICRFIKS